MGDSRGNPIYTFDGDASRKIKIKSLRETSVSVAQVNKIYVKCVFDACPQTIKP